jgi:hypothetical protein
MSAVLEKGIELTTTVSLRAGGNLGRYQPVGWSTPERWFTWALGNTSSLRIPTRGRQDYILELDVAPLVHPPEILQQRLHITVNGFRIGEPTLREKRTLAYLVRAELLTQQTDIELALGHPDALRPSDMGLNKDSRLLAVAYSSIRLFSLPAATARDLPETLEPQALPPEPPNESRTARFGRLLEHSRRMTRHSLADLMASFESLGQNCEFGLAQRALEAEHPGLLRFSSIRLPHLLKGLSNRFEHIDDAAHLEVKMSGPAPREYMVRQRRYDLLYHTFQHEGQISREELLRRQSVHLRFLRDKLLDDLEQAGKIFVITRHKALQVEDVLPLFTALSRYGPNWLLYVVPADAEHPPGTVEKVAARLLQGYIDRFAPAENAYDLSLEVWLQLCINAYRHRFPTDGTATKDTAS